MAIITEMSFIQGWPLSEVPLYTCVCNWDKWHVAVIERWPQFKARNNKVPLYCHVITCYPRPHGRRVQYLVCVCVCVCVCVSVCLLPQNCCKLSQNLNKLQVTNLVI